MPTVTRREVTIAILWSVFIMVLTSGPYVAGRLGANGRHFGGLISAVDDGNAYLQWIRQVSEGSWTLSNQYSADEGQGLSFNLFFFVLGKTARFLSLTPAQVFNAARILAGCLCLVSLFLLAAAFSPDPAFRWTALFLVSLSAGFGWLVDMLSPGAVPRLQPIDYGARWIYQPEAITFLSLLVNPLFAFSLALMCLSLLCAFRSLDTGRLGWALAAGLFLMVLGNVHTYDIPVVHLTIVAWMVMAVATKRLSLGRALLCYAVMLVMTLPAGVWQWHVMNADPLYRAKADTPTLSRPYFDYALGYGVPWLLAVVGLIWVLRTKAPIRHRLIYLVPWAVIAGAVIYAPVPWQRKMAEGMHFPICLLAAIAVANVLGGWLTRDGHSSRRSEARLFLAATVIVLISMPSNVLFYADCFRHLRTNNADLAHVMMPPIYLEPGEIAAMRELAGRCTNRDVVLSSSMMGSHIPVYAPCRVVAGHWGESVYLVATPSDGVERAPFERYALPIVLRFFSAGRSSTEKARILLRFKVTYVFCGPVENALYAGSLPRLSGEPPAADASVERELAALPFLRQAFSQDGVVLFEVAPRRALRRFVRSASSGRIESESVSP